MVTIDFGVAREIYYVSEYPSSFSEDEIRTVLEQALNWEDVPITGDDIGNFYGIVRNYLVAITDDNQVRILKLVKL